MYRMGYVVGQFWVMLFLWVVVALLVAGREARGQSRVADFRHYNAMMAGKDCSVFRVVASRAAAEAKELKQRLQDQRRLSEERRVQLESCAKGKGMKTFSDDDEALLAEVCPTEYKDWVSPGFRVQITREDLQEVSRGLQTLQMHLDWSCQTLPTTQEVSATVSNPPPLLPTAEAIAQ